MKKPINKWALVIWIIAAILFVGDVYSFEHMREAMISLPIAQPEAPFIPAQIWSAIHGAFFTLAFLTGVGIIIELLDQIRWDAINRK